MRVIVDTNVLISGLLTPTGAPGKIVNAILDGRIIAVFSQETAAELRDVLARPKLQQYFTRAGVNPAVFFDHLLEIIEVVHLGETSLPIRDPKDRPFLGLAASKPRPDALVTGDQDFTASEYSQVPVIPPSSFVKMLDL